MAQYATASELASYLKQDLDTSTATLALQVASAEFSRLADTWWTAQAVTYQVEGRWSWVLDLPYRPVIDVDEVRINGAVITDWTRINERLYRTGGFGSRAFPPDSVEVDLTYGYTVVPDDVKGAVLEIAGLAYQNPDRLVSEAIDDYTVRFGVDAGGLQVSAGAALLARTYRGVNVG